MTMPSRSAALVLAGLATLLLSACAGSPSLAVDERSRLAGRTYVLLGASSGLGRGVAQELAAYGARLVLAARRADALEEVAAEVRRLGGEALVVPMDISQPDDVQRLADAAVTRFGHLDVWINFAGIGAIGRFWDVPAADHLRVVDVNLKGFMLASHAALRLFRGQGDGLLVNLGSVESEVPLAYQASYSSTKAAIRSLGQAVNQELRLAGLDRIRVATVEPWAVDTPFFVHAANYSGGTPRMPLPDDPRSVVDAIVWISLHPRAELPVGWKAQAAWFGHRLMPRLGQRIAADITHRYQIETAPPAALTSGNLHAPMAEGRGVDGGVRERMQREDESRRQGSAGVVVP